MTQGPGTSGGVIKKTVNAAVKSIKLKNISYHNSLGLPKVKETEKRKEGYVSPLAQIDNPSFFTLSDTAIRSTFTLSDAESQDLPDGELFRQEVAVKLQNNTLEVRSKKRSKYPETQLVELQLPDHYLNGSLPYDIKILKSTKIRTTEYVQYDQPLLLIVNHSKVTQAIDITLLYKFSIIESFGIYFNSDLLNNSSAVLQSLLVPTEHPLTVPINNKLFYDIVTENAINYPVLEKPPLVAELDTELLAFQGKTVNWMLSRENVKYNPETFSVEDVIPQFKDDLSDSEVRSMLDMLSFGFELVHLESIHSDPIWYNKYTGNIITKAKAIEYLRSLRRPGGTGLLCEEMGLGKTIEVISLSLLNPRPQSQLYESYLDGYNRTVNKIKSSLIICPSSILEQWVNEINTHAPSLKVIVYDGMYAHRTPVGSPEAGKRTKYRTMTPAELATELASHDIVITTYSTVASEVYNAAYNPERAKRRRTNGSVAIDVKEEDYDKEDYEVVKGFHEDRIKSESFNRDRIDKSSPLVILEFWRLILDESQTVGTDLSSRCRIATLIPRHHAWAVSGTPIRNSVSDLNALLTFLKFEPFCGVRKTWKTLLEDSYDFTRLFSLLGFRHTKEMVKDEIKLPGQRRMLMSIPFGAIEQNNYDELYKRFLKEVGLDANGNPVIENWEPTPAYFEKMRNWLHILRSTCCHASLDFDDTSNNSGLNKFNSMEAVLQRMISGENERVLQLEKEKTLSKLEIGQIYEFTKHPELALETWSEELENVEQRINEMRSQFDSAKNDAIFKTTFRIFLELLHRLHFFVASAHFQHYDPKIPELVHGVEETDIDPAISNERAVDLPSVVVHTALTKEEAEHQDLETHHYSIAQSIRKEILIDSIKNVQNSIGKMANEFHLPINPAPERFIFHSVHCQLLYTRVCSLLNNLNEQALVLNRYFEKLIQLLLIPLLDTVTDPSGEEYGHSLDDQNDSSAYLEVIQAAMKNRDILVLGDSNGEFYESININPTTETVGEESLQSRLEKELPHSNLIYSLKSLLMDAKTLMAKIDDETSFDYKLLDRQVIFLKREFDVQKTASEDYKKKFRSFNDTYNLKITYFRQLQELSDNVAPFGELTHGNYDTERRLLNLSSELKRADTKINEIQSRVRYLETLSLDYDPDETEKVCIICRNSITDGSLLKCGHKYCKECLEIWLRSKNICPVCKQRVHKADIYNFTFNRDVINITLGVEHNGDEGYHEEIAEIYERTEKKSLQSLKQIPLESNYGSKIDTIVRQILWLKRHDTSVQVVIYSQWGKFLNIIGKALKKNGITFVGSDRSTQQTYTHTVSLLNNVSSFKKNPRITCFLLNAKVDASGLNLINATHVFICEPLVQTALESQAISRIHRIGQRKPTTIWMFSIAGSVEENIVLSASRKRNKEKEKLETEDVSKTIAKNLVANSGELVSSDDLWNSFFSSRTGFDAQ